MTKRRRRRRPKPQDRQRARPAAPLALRAWRHYTVLTLFLLAVTGLAVRAGYLATTERDFLKEQGEARSVREVKIPVHRGMIFDRNGEPLAVSAPMSYVWIDPQSTRLTDADQRRLANALGLTPAILQQRLDRGGQRFAYLSRRVPPDVVRRVDGLNIDGVRHDRAYHRFYPAGETLAHVVGRTDIDDVGQEGIELALNDALTGQPGAKRVLRDRTGKRSRSLTFRAPRNAARMSICRWICACSSSPTESSRRRCRSMARRRVRW